MKRRPLPLHADFDQLGCLYRRPISIFRDRFIICFISCVQRVNQARKHTVVYQKWSRCCLRLCFYVCRPLNFTVAKEAMCCSSRSTWKATCNTFIRWFWQSALCVIRKRAPRALVSTWRGTPPLISFPTSGSCFNTVSLNRRPWRTRFNTMVNSSRSIYIVSRGLLLYSQLVTVKVEHVAIRI